MSAYSGLAPDARGNSSWFLTRTNKEHEATMEHPFMKSIYAESFDTEAYCQYLAGLLHIFSALESLCAAKNAGPPLSSVDDQVLHRREALRKDLAVWWGSDWEKKAEKISPATADYLEQLQKDSADPWLLLCHHFLQYNAVLSGGQFLGSKVSNRAKKTFPSGVEYYTFALPKDQLTHARVQCYLDEVDKFEISQELRDRMLECMRRVYQLILATFDEAYNVCKVEGVSYASVKKSGKASVPPPMEPGDRNFTASELANFDGSDPSKPLLTSVLGRIYDVSNGKVSFGPDGPYAMFAGHDGTYNLAVMSLKKQTVDKFKYVLEQDDKECLSDWIAYFDNHYGRPLGILRDRTHAIAIKDLPRATKIPFQETSETPSSRL